MLTALTANTTLFLLPTVELNWVGEGGKFHSWGEIPIGDSKSMNSFVGHTFAALEPGTKRVLKKVVVVKGMTSVVF